MSEIPQDHAGPPMPTYHGPKPILVVPGQDITPPQGPVAPVVMASTALLETLYEYDRLLKEKGEVSLYLAEPPTDKELEDLSNPDLWYAILDHPDALRRLLVVRREEVDKLTDTLLACLGECRTGVGEQAKSRADLCVSQFLTILAKTTGSEILRHVAGIYDAILRTTTLT